MFSMDFFRVRMKGSKRRFLDRGEGGMRILNAIAQYTNLASLP